MPSTNELLYAEQAYTAPAVSTSSNPSHTSARSFRSSSPLNGTPLRTRLVFGLLTLSTLIGSGMVVAPVVFVS